MKVISKDLVKKNNLENSNIPSFLSFIDRVNTEIPIEENVNLPKDFAQNLDHYLYGTSKEQA